MSNKSNNGKKPKLAQNPSGHNHDQLSGLLAGAEPQGPDGSAPGKHKLSFAQHQHGLAPTPAASPAPLPEGHRQQLKSDAQQRQQKAGAHK